MQLCFHGATIMHADLQTDIAVTAKAGYGGLEIWTNKLEAFLHDHSLTDLKAMFADHGVQPMTLNSLENVSFQAAAFASTKAHCRQLCEIAVAIGSPAIAVIPSPKPHGEISWNQVLEEHVRVLRTLADIAAPYGVKLAFEFIGRSHFSVRTPRAAAEIIQAADRENVGLVVDIAHLTVGGCNLAEIDRLDPKRIYAFHLDDVEDMTLERYSEADRVLPGQGIARTQEICSRLAAISFDGPATVELFRPEYWQRDPFEVAVMARDAALEVLKPYFVVQHKQISPALHQL